MYKVFIRPILFLFPPETIHKWLVLIVKRVSKSFIIRKIINKSFNLIDSKLEKELFGITFRNSVGLAAGFDKNGDFFQEFGNFGFGHIEIGTVTPLPQPGNPKPRSFRLTRDKALINRMGINNQGVDYVVKMLKNRPKGLVIGGNIGKNTLTPNENAVNDFGLCFEKLYDYVDYFVVNVSCPNIGDISKLQDQDTLEDILQRLCNIRAKKQQKRPVLLKLSPDLNFKQIDETIKIIQQTGIDGVVATNTTILREGLKTDQNKIMRIGRGGLSGLPLRDRSTEIIKYIKAKTNGKMPVIGVGGIMTVQDALEKLDAGADLIQVYTGFIYEGPCLAKRINRAILKR